MSQSTLVMGYTEIRVETMKFLGLGTSSSNWSNDQVADFETIKKAGLRQFYIPPPIPPSVVSHRWSFLQQLVTISTVSGTQQYALPNNFGGIVRPITFLSTSQGGDILLTSESQIRRMRQGSTSSGTPRYACVSPFVSQPSVMPTWMLDLWPTPGGAYDIQFRCQIVPNDIDSTNPYPLGGAQHSETILESILAKAEQLKNDEPNGLHRQMFMERLFTSVEYDKRQPSVQFLGIENDPSTARGGRGYRDGNPVTYSGITYP